MGGCGGRAGEIHRVLKPGGIAYMSFSNRSGPQPPPHRSLERSKHTQTTFVEASEIVFQTFCAACPRCFPTKVVGMWLETNDAGHIWIVGSYFHHCGGFEPAVVHDIGSGPAVDPMYVIAAAKVGERDL